MDITLTREHERFIKRKVKAGRFETPSDAVLVALCLLEDHEALREIKLKRLKREIQKGIDSLDRGKGIPMTPDFFEDIKRRGRQRLARKQKRKRST